MMIYCDGVSFSLCVMKNDHFLNFVKARLNEVVTRIFGLGDLWMGGRIVAKKG